MASVVAVTLFRIVRGIAVMGMGVKQGQHAGLEISRRLTPCRGRAEAKQGDNDDKCDEATQHGTPQ